MVPTHEIFQKPFAVNLEFEDEPTPADYRHWPGGDKLGEKIKVWRVQTKNFPEIDPGLVSDPYGFADSPDAEVISSGLNSKGPESVALGRHGNFFLWGFSASPSDMTPDGRTCFLNAICYIKKFDGQRPMVRKTSQGRRWALVYAGYPKMFSEDRVKQMVEEFRKRKDEMPEELRKQVGDDPEGYYRKMMQSSLDSIMQMFPKDLRDRFGMDADKYRRYYEENLEYLHPSPTGGSLAVDEDVKALGISNRNVELLDRCIGMLGDDSERDRAMRILKRYTSENFDNADQWRGWLNKNRDRLFFTDTGGYKFLIAPEPLASQSVAR